MIKYVFMFDNYNSQTYKKKTNIRHDKIKQVYFQQELFRSWRNKIIPLKVKVFVQKAIKVNLCLKGKQIVNSKWLIGTLEQFWIIFQSNLSNFQVFFNLLLCCDYWNHGRNNFILFQQKWIFSIFKLQMHSPSLLVD